VNWKKSLKFHKKSKDDVVAARNSCPGKRLSVLQLVWAGI
jgi:hypothetical protein